MSLGFFAWNAGLALGGVARVSQVQFLQIFLIASLIVHEAIERQTLLYATGVMVIVCF